MPCKVCYGKYPRDDEMHAMHHTLRVNKYENHPPPAAVQHTAFISLLSLPQLCIVCHINILHHINLST